MVCGLPNDALTGVYFAGEGAKHQSRHREAPVPMANRGLPDSPRTLQSKRQQGYISNSQRVGASGGSKASRNSSASARGSFRCQICHAIFQTMAQVKSHEKTHSSAKYFMCRFCGKILVGSKLRHERIHTGEKPYQCNICYKSFNVRCNMNRHIRMVHGSSGETQSEQSEQWNWDTGAEGLGE